MAPTNAAFYPPQFRPEDVSPEAVGVAARKLWESLDGKLQRLIAADPAPTLIASQLVLRRMLLKTRATLLGCGMTEDQLAEFEQVNGLFPIDAETEN